MNALKEGFFGGAYLENKGHGLNGGRRKVSKNGPWYNVSIYIYIEREREGEMLLTHGIFWNKCHL